MLAVKDKSFSKHSGCLFHNMMRTEVLTTKKITAFFREIALRDRTEDFGKTPLV